MSGNIHLHSLFSFLLSPYHVGFLYENWGLFVAFYLLGLCLCFVMALSGRSEFDLALALFASFPMWGY